MEIENSTRCASNFLTISTRTFPSQRSRMRTCVWTISVIVCLLSSQVVFTQSQSDKADLSGIVYDSSGAVVPSATITITSSSTGLVRTASTDRLGHYRLPVLPPGVYSVRTDAPGFASIVHKEV